MDLTKNFSDFFLEFPNLINFKIVDGNLSKIFISLLIFFSFFIFRNIFVQLVRKKIGFFFSPKAKSSKIFLKSIDGPLKFFPIALGFFFASGFLEVQGKIYIFFENINQSFFTVLFFWFFHQIIRPILLKIENIEKIFTTDLMDWIINSLKILIIVLGISAVLEIWGIRVGPVIAGLGLFGVAVALGAQDLFKNLISGILVLIEKRFKKGDVIIISNVIEGTVEKIGFRSTAIRRFDKSLCFIPNAQFAENAVTNITKITHRRINWIIGLEYKSTVDQLKKICKDIEQHIKNNKKEFFVSDSTPVIVKVDAFAASSIDVLIRCFTNTNDYQEFLTIKDSLAIDIKKIVEKRKCSFAFPSQSLYIEKNN